MYQKTIFLNWDFDSYFLHSFSVAPNDFNFWLRLMDIALKCAFLDYCYVFHFLCYETCLSSHLHTVGLLHSHWNHSSPTLNSFNHQCCIVVTSTTTITFSKSLRVFFIFFLFHFLPLVGLWRWWLSVYHQGDHDPHGQLHLSCRWLRETFSDPHSSSEW